MATTFSSGGQSPTSLSRTLERVLEDAQHTGIISLSGRKFKEYPKISSKYELGDTISTDLSKNRFSEIPSQVCEYRSLERLNCYHNVIKFLPESLVQLQNLTHLCLSRNLLTVIPPFIKQLHVLEVLIASHNKIVSLPEEIGELKRLMEIDVSCNEVSHLPTQIGDLKSLRSLNIRRNLLVELPVEIGKLSLRKLDFSSNRISKLPTNFRKLETLEEFILDHNPLVLPPAHVCTKGKQHIMKFLQIEAIKEDKKWGVINESEMKRLVRKSLPPQNTVSSDDYKNLIDTSPENKWKRHTVLSSDSGYSTTDSLEKCGWSPSEVITNGVMDDRLALKAGMAAREQQQSRELDNQRRNLNARPPPINTAYSAENDMNYQNSLSPTTPTPQQYQPMYPPSTSIYSAHPSGSLSSNSPQSPATPVTPKIPIIDDSPPFTEDEFTRELNRQKIEYDRKKKQAEQLRREEEEKEQRRRAAQKIQEEQKALLERQRQKELQLKEEARLQEEARQREEARMLEEQKVREEAQLREEERLREEARLIEEQRQREEAKRQAENNYYYQSWHTSPSSPGYISTSSPGNMSPATPSYSSSSSPGYSPGTPGYSPGTPGYSPAYTPGTPGYSPSTPGYSPGYYPSPHGYPPISHSPGYAPPGMRYDGHMPDNYNMNHRKPIQSSQSFSKEDRVTSNTATNQQYRRTVSDTGKKQPSNTSAAPSRTNQLKNQSSRSIPVLQRRNGASGPVNGKSPNSPGISPSPSPRSSTGSAGPSPASSTSSLHKSGGDKSGVGSVVPRRTKVSDRVASAASPATATKLSSSRPATSTSASRTTARAPTSATTNNIKKNHLTPVSFSNNLSLRHCQAGTLSNATCLQADIALCGSSSGVQKLGTATDSASEFVAVDSSKILLDSISEKSSFSVDRDSLITHDQRTMSGNNTKSLCTQSMKSGTVENLQAGFECMSLNVKNTEYLSHKSWPSHNAYSNRDQVHTLQVTTAKAAHPPSNSEVDETVPPRLVMKRTAGSTSEIKSTKDSEAAHKDIKSPNIAASGSVVQNEKVSSADSGNDPRSAGRGTSTPKNYTNGTSPQSQCIQGDSPQTTNVKNIKGSPLNSNSLNSATVKNLKLSNQQPDIKSSSGSPTSNRKAINSVAHGTKDQKMESKGQISAKPQSGNTSSYTSNEKTSKPTDDQIVSKDQGSSGRNQKSLKSDSKTSKSGTSKIQNVSSSVNRKTETRLSTKMSTRSTGSSSSSLNSSRSSIRSTESASESKNLKKADSRRQSGKSSLNSSRSSVRSTESGSESKILKKADSRRQSGTSSLNSSRSSVRSTESRSESMTLKKADSKRQSGTSSLNSSRSSVRSTESGSERKTLKKSDNRQSGSRSLGTSRSSVGSSEAGSKNRITKTLDERKSQSGGNPKSDVTLKPGTKETVSSSRVSSTMKECKESKTTSSKMSDEKPNPETENSNSSEFTLNSVKSVDSAGCNGKLSKSRLNGNLQESLRNSKNSVDAVLSNRRNTKQESKSTKNNDTLDSKNVSSSNVQEKNSRRAISNDISQAKTEHLKADNSSGKHTSNSTRGTTRMSSTDKVSTVFSTPSEQSSAAALASTQLKGPTQTNVSKTEGEISLDKTDSNDVTPANVSVDNKLSPDSSLADTDILSRTSSRSSIESNCSVVTVIENDNVRVADGSTSARNGTCPKSGMVDSVFSDECTFSLVRGPHKPLSKDSTGQLVSIRGTAGQNKASVQAQMSVVSQNSSTVRNTSTIGKPDRRKLTSEEELRQKQQNLKTNQHPEPNKVRGRVDDTKLRQIQKDAVNNFVAKRAGVSTPDDDKRRPGVGTQSRTSNYSMSNRHPGGGSTMKVIDSYKDADPSFTMRRQEERLREEAEQLERLRRTIETKLKVTLPDNLPETLGDGVLLCQLANNIRPRSVTSIHVPSPAVPKLTMAKCRKNVENFLDACRKIGVKREQICAAQDILDERGLSRVAITIAALVGMTSNPKASSAV